MARIFHHEEDDVLAVIEGHTTKKLAAIKGKPKKEEEVTRGPLSRTETNVRAKRL
jgi:hypothetical protein